MVPFLSFYLRRRQAQAVSGEVEADSRSQATAMLQKQGVVLSELKALRSITEMEFDFFNTVSNKEVVLILFQE